MKSTLAILTFPLKLALCAVALAVMLTLAGIFALEGDPSA